jgi:hypothetical protein
MAVQVDGGHADIVDFLLKSGAFPHARLDNDDTVLHVACRRLPDVRHDDRDGMRSAMARIVSLLLAADVMQCAGADGRYPLHFAARAGDLRIVKQLVDSAGGVWARVVAAEDCSGLTAADIAAKCDHPRVFEYLTSIARMCSGGVSPVGRAVGVGSALSLSASASPSALRSDAAVAGSRAGSPCSADSHGCDSAGDTTAVDSLLSLVPARVGPATTATATAISAVNVSSAAAEDDDTGWADDASYAYNSADDDDERASSDSERRDVGDGDAVVGGVADDSVDGGMCTFDAAPSHIALVVASLADAPHGSGYWSCE